MAIIFRSNSGGLGFTLAPAKIRVMKFAAGIYAFSLTRGEIEEIQTIGE